MTVLLIGLGATAALYALAARGQTWPAHRTLAFTSGLLVLLAALGPPLDTEDTSLLSLHMVQHGLLTLVAAPLLVTGAPLRLALRRLAGGRRRALGRVLGSRPLHLLTRPAVGLALFTGALLGTHLTPVYDLAVRDDAVHVAEHALYLWTAVLFWVPLIAADPVRHAPGWLGRCVVLLLAAVPMGIVGALLDLSDRVRYPAYEAPARALHVSALADQHLAGAIMWVGGGLAATGLTVALVWSALAREERRQRAREAHATARRVRDEAVAL